MTAIRKSALMVGHFPPPVHGMAVAFEALANELSRDLDVVRVVTSPNSLEPSASYHLVRLVRVVKAMFRLARHRYCCERAFFSVDAGLGLVYLLAMVGLARLLRYKCVLQHHSYAYLAKRSLLMQALAFVSAASLHLCSCCEMTADLRARYPRLKNVRNLPLTYALPRQTPASAKRASPTGPISIGLFGNLTMDKGLGEAIDTVEVLLERKVDCRLVLAGPALGEEERRLIADVTTRSTGRIVAVGPIYGADRDALLASLDVLLFPSRYSHESFGLALWECLRVGTTAIAYRSGCLTQRAVGPGALILDRSEDFVARATAAITEWASDRSKLDLLGMNAQQRCAEAIAVGHDAVRDLVAEFAS